MEKLIQQTDRVENQFKQESQPSKNEPQTKFGNMEILEIMEKQKLRRAEAESVYDKNHVGNVVSN